MIIIGALIRTAIGIQRRNKSAEIMAHKLQKRFGPSQFFMDVIGDMKEFKVNLDPHSHRHADLWKDTLVDFGNHYGPFWSYGTANDVCESVPCDTPLWATAEAARFAAAVTMMGDGLKKNNKTLFRMGAGFYVTHCDPFDRDECKHLNQSVKSAREKFGPESVEDIPDRARHKMCLAVLGRGL